MRSFLLLVLVLTACDRSISRAPLRIGAKSGASEAISQQVALRLERAGCVVERRFGIADSVVADALLRSGAIDAYVESHAEALTKVLRQKAQAGPAAESVVRIAYVKANLVWAPPVGAGDLAVVFRKEIDERCRAASRTLMATGSMLAGR